MRASTLILNLMLFTTAHADREQARAFKAQGDFLVQRGKETEALTAYENAIQADPEWLVAWDAVAASLFAAGRHADVITRLKLVIDKHPDYNNGLYSIAYAYRKTGKNAESVDAYQRYLKLRPDDAEAYYGLGRAQAALGNQPEALAAYDKYLALERRPTEKRWIEKARAEHAALKKAGVPLVPIGDEAGSPGGRSIAARATAVCDQADSARTAKKFQQAFDLYLGCRIVDPSSTRAYDGIGETGLVLRKYNDLIPLFRSALADIPGYAPGFYYLARALRESSKTVEALEPLKRFTALQPTNPEGWLELGLLLRGTGDKAGAITAFKKYLQVENRSGHDAARKTVTDTLKELGAN
jgi:tetratricopeptide (TPR) repeat protein